MRINDYICKNQSINATSSLFMRHLIWIFFSLLISVECLADSSADNNIVIDSRIVTYLLKAQGDQLSEVKVSETTHYIARRADARTFAVTFYGDGITIDKAHASGSQPIYRSWVDDDLFYSGSRVCALPLNLKKDKPAKVVFERTYKDPEQFCQIMLISPYFTRHLEYRVQVPNVLVDKIVLMPKNFAEGMELVRKDEPNGDVIYSVIFNNEEPFKPESMSGSADMTAPQILVKGYFDNVESLYGFLREKVDENETSDNVAELARKLCEGLNTEQDKIDAIAAWVRNNIRYVGIEHGEYGLKPEAAETVLTNRYGDCKGSANLIRVMLRAVGIDGRLAWIGTRGDVPGDWTEIESLAAGNHQIAAAVVGDSVIFIDGTTQFAPKGFIPNTIGGQQCLVLNGDNVLIATVPEATRNMLQMTGETELKDGALAGRYEAKYGGEMRMALLSSLNAVSAPKRNAALEILLAFDRQSVRAENIVLNEGDSDAQTAEIVFDEADKAAVRELSSGKTYIQLRPFKTALYPTLDAKNRKHDILFRHPYDLSSTIVFKIPEGYEIESLPERIDIATPWFVGFMEYTMDQSNDRVICSAALQCVKTEGDYSEAESWNSAIKEIKNASSTPLVLVKK